MRSVSKGSEDPHRYADMLDLPNHRSGTHRPLSKQQRAAQFLPFSALSGYEDGIEESQRLTIQRNVLSSEQKEEMDLTMQKILAMDHPEVTVTWFEDDLFKDGGQYHTKTGILRRVEPSTGRLMFADRTVIWLASVDDIRIVKEEYRLD